MPGAYTRPDLAGRRLSAKSYYEAGRPPNDRHIKPECPTPGTFCPLARPPALDGAWQPPPNS